MIGIQGQRLYLAPMQESSLDKLYAWKNDLGMLEQMMAQPTFASYEAVKDWLARNNADRNQVFLGVYLKEQHELIGVVRLMFIDWISRTCEIGAYIGDTQNRGKGYGREMMTLVIDYGLKSLNLHKVIFRMLDTDNVFKALYKSMGAEHEGLQRKQVWVNGRYHDVCLMGLINE